MKEAVEASATMEHVGILHPGAMGTCVAATVRNAGHHLWWVPEGRSRITRDRADEFGFRPVASLTELAARCPILISVCPPHAAEELALAVVEAGFNGLFVDANAISPRRARRIGDVLRSAGVVFVDGGITGLPAWEPGRTRIYLSGPRAREVAALFGAGPLEAKCLDAEIGRASALKMCYAGNSKGTRALLLAVLATAEALGVREDLEAELELEQGGQAKEIVRRVRATSPKAWRWTGEMEEIAVTFGDAGLPRGFHEASREVYRRLSGFKDAADLPEIEEILGTLLP
jgi:3-hydroxyisobutyrate dehydrogenase-like beta-hydroxyacid dehydrogenase